MNSVKLIQRLKKPQGFMNPFSFGGGYKNGGLSDETVDILKDIWSFDYMGAAEFEHGEIPYALSYIWDYCEKNNTKHGKLNLVDVYYLCEKSIEKKVQEVIVKLSNGTKYDLKGNPEISLLEECFLKENLNGEKFAQEYGGWLELNNSFMFFTDKKMYEDTLKLFELKK